MNHKEIIESFGNAAQFGSLLVALIALFVATYALRPNRLLERENIATQIWREYKKIALSYPQYYVDERLIFDFEKRTLEGSRENFQQYQWLVSFTLTACEEVLTIYRNKEDWKNTVNWQVTIHRQFIQSSYFAERGYMGALGPEVQAIVRKNAQLPFNRMAS